MQYKLHGTDQRCLEVLCLVLCSADIEVTLSFHSTPQAVHDASADPPYSTPVLARVHPRLHPDKNSMLLMYELRLKMAINCLLNLADLQDVYPSSCTRHTSHPMPNQLVLAQGGRVAAGDRPLQLGRAGPWG